MKRYTSRTLILEMLMITAGVLFAFPLYVLVNLSLRHTGNITSPVVPTSSPTLANYAEAWRAAGLFPALINSAVVALVSLVVIILVSAFAAYPLARATARWSCWTYLLFSLGLLLPAQLALIPLYQSMRDIHLLGSLWSLIIFYSGLQVPFSIFLYSGFLRGIPLEYEEAAAIDGCGPVRVFFSVVSASPSRHRNRGNPERDLYMERFPDPISLSVGELAADNSGSNLPIRRPICFELATGFRRPRHQCDPHPVRLLPDAEADHPGFRWRAEGLIPAVPPLNVSREQWGQMIGMKDVAKHAGVSVATVSNVINSRDVVKKETRIRVLTAIQDLGYVRDASARQLRSRESKLLAFLILEARNPFYSGVIRGAEQVAADEGLHIITCSSGQRAETEASYLSMLAEHRVRGVLFSPVDDESGRSLLNLTRSGLSCVLVDSNPLKYEACSVSVDDVVGARLAVQHLLDQGHTRIAMINGPSRLAPCRKREQGARAALTEALGTDRGLSVVTVEELDVASGREAGTAVLHLDHHPTAVFCANDLLALGVLQAVVAEGLRVPEDMAIVGYDDIEFAAAAAVPLTSVRQPTLQLGRTAARLLIEETSPGGGQHHRHQAVVFKPELVVRGSTHHVGSSG